MMFSLFHRFSTVLLLGMVTVFCSASGTPASDSWPGYRGTLADGHAVANSVFVGKTKPGLKLAWSTPIGSAYSGVVVAEGMAVTFYAEGEKDMAGAFDVETGKKLWSYEIGPTYVGHDGSHNGPIGTPAIANGRVFGLGGWGEFFALDAKTGMELWTHHLANDYKQEIPFYGFGTHPLIYKEKVILMVGGENHLMMAFEPKTGKEVWAAGSGTLGYQSPIIWRQNGKTMLVGASDKELIAVDPDNGHMLWSYEHQGKGAKGVLSMVPVPAGENRLFLTHLTDKSTMLQVTQNGEAYIVAPVWESRTVRNSYTPPIYHESYVYGYNTRTLTCMDAKNGELVWRSRAPGDGFVMLADRHLVIATKAGVLSVVKAHPSGYEEVASLKVFDKTAWPLTASVGNRIYMRSFDSIVRVDVLDSAMAVATTEKVSGTVMTDLLKEVAASADKQAVVARFLKAQSSFPVIEGKKFAHFLYEGDVSDVALAGDMIGARQEKAMTRLPGTNLFYLSLALESDAMLTYLFVTDFGGSQQDPRNPRKTQSYLLGEEMDFNRTGKPMPMSWFSMPDYKQPAYMANTESKPAGKLESHELESERLEKKYSAKVYLPAGYNQEKSYPVAYVLNPKAFELGRWQQALDLYMGKQIKEIITVFVDLRVDNPKGAKVMTEEFIPFVEKNYRTLANREGRVLVGIGFSGPAAFDFVLERPETFATVALQSAGYFTDVHHSYKTRLEALTGKPPVRYYVDWGTYDLRNPEEAWDVSVFNSDLARMLKKRGLDVTSKQFNQGSDWTSWRARTGYLLQKVFPIN